MTVEEMEGRYVPADADDSVTGSEVIEAEIEDPDNPFQDEVEEPDEGADLGDVAASGLLEDEGGQEALVAEPAKLSFVGVPWDDVDRKFVLQEDVAFLVKGRVIEIGTRIMADGHERHFVKIDLKSTVPYKG